jgi:hypothetical protein
MIDFSITAKDLQMNYLKIDDRFNEINASD